MNRSFNSRQDLVQLSVGYTAITSETRYNATIEVDIQYNLAPKQILQRLPITIAQIKAVSTSENLHHEF